MIKKTITYQSLFGDKPVTEEYYFHISKADLIEMEMEEHKVTATAPDGEKLTGMRAKLQKIMDAEDGKEILAQIKDIVRRAYGKREGERFIKSRELADEFMATEAASQLIFDLCTNPSAAAEFMNGIVPNNLEQIAAEVQEIAELEESNGATAASAVPPADNDVDRAKEIANATSDNPVTISQSELIVMDHTELKSGLADGRYKLS